MTKGDLLVERGAQGLQSLASRAAQRGDGIGEWLAEELTADAAFLRKLKPSLIAARAKGDAPTNASPASPQPPAPSGPQFGRRPKKKRSKPGGASPLLVVGIALAAGILAAKVIDWRGHAHPRD
jgi:hypothetical protein